jgi:hypothetical protein
MQRQSRNTQKLEGADQSTRYKNTKKEGSKAEKDQTAVKADHFVGTTDT